MLKWKWDQEEAQQLATKVQKILDSWNRKDFHSPQDFLDKLYETTRAAHVSELNARLNSIPKQCCGPDQICPGCE